MARLWDTDMADKAATIDQAIKLGGVVVRPPRVTGFDRPRPEPAEHGSSHLPGQSDEEF